MKKLYTTLLVSLFIFAAPQVKSNPLEPLSSKDRLDLVELGQPIHHIIFNQQPIHQTNDDQIEYIPPYTCPACIISLTSYPIKKTKSCVKSTRDICCNLTCDPICMFMFGYNYNTVAAKTAGHPLIATDDSCCGKCNTSLRSYDKSLEKNVKKCEKFCDYTFCCRWLEQHPHRNEE